jgi:hypothetical protein
MRIRVDPSLTYEQHMESVIQQLKDQGVEFTPVMEAFFRVPMTFSNVSIQGVLKDALSAPTPPQKGE